MLTGKQKAYLRSLAHELNPVFQIGKDGINDNMLRDINFYLLKHELMKISVLNNCMEDITDLATIFELAGINVVQIIGHVIVLYKKNSKLEKSIKLPSVSRKDY